MKPTALILLAAAVTLAIPIAARGEESPECTSSRSRLVDEERPELFVSAEVLEFKVKAGDAAGPKFFLVSASREGVAYSASVSGANWLEFDPATGRTSADGDPVAVRVNTAKLKAGSYETVLRVSAWRGSNAPAVRVKVLVADVR